MKILSFYINGCLYGADIGYIKELNRSISVIDVPTAPDFVCGLYNMRGQAVTVIYAEHFLRQTRSEEDREYCVALKPYQNAPDLFGFFIDKAAEVHHVDEKAILPPPSGISEGALEYILGAVECEGALITLIAVNQILEQLI